MVRPFVRNRAKRRSPAAVTAPVPASGPDLSTDDGGLADDRERRQSPPRGRIRGPL